MSGPAMSAAPAIEVRGLRKAYGRHEAVRGIDFEVERGEVFGFLGPNGAGKTTTIEILEGYRDRTGGDVAVLGVDPQRSDRSWRNRVGLVLQECQLDPTLTVRETLSLYASFYTAPRSVDEIISLVGLDDKKDARLGTLSGGQKRRADVGVGIVGDPELVFLDEPTTGFDPSARRSAWNMIEGLKQLGKTIFLTTHYMDEAQHLADRVIILRQGEIVAQGKPDELGDSLGSASEVRFRLPEGVTADQLRQIVHEEVAASGSEVSFRTDNAQKALFELTGWAERHHMQLADLEVQRPTLEDIFLQLTQEPEGADK
jgi:ABC-2 type transport system ATP-binding protein